MMWWGWLILALILVIAILVVVLWQLASRLDRLHKRVLTARAGLERGLVKRNAELLCTADLAGLDPQVAAAMRDAATESLTFTELPLVGDGLKPDVTADRGEVERRGLSESKVSRIIRDSLTPEVRTALATDAVSQAQLDALDQACYKVELARTLHNQDVVQARALRGHPAVRLFHLAGRAPVPNFVDLDDQTK